MVLAQKRYIFIIVSVLLTLFLYQTQRYGHTRTSSGLTPPSSYSPLPHHNGKWTWTDRSIHYPLTPTASLPKGKPKKLHKVQYTFGTESSNERSIRLERRQAVKDVFLRCWKSYRSRAWMQDELSPISGGSRNTFGGWAATLVDSLDTLWIMDMKDEFYDAVTAAMDIDFTTSTDETINVFETTIRYLGGFLAAHDLSNDIRLLHKAIEIGEMLLAPFDTPNHMPITRWQWKKSRNGVRMEAPGGMLVSELGSLSLEFTRLSQLTGDQRWYDAVNRITRLFDEQQSKTKLPGMWPIAVNPRDEDMTVDTGFTLGGMSDSLYEYFPKMYVLLGGLEPVYQKLYEDSMSTAEKHLFFRPMTPNEDDILVAGDARVDSVGSIVTLDARAQHLTCFAGGMLLLGGKLFLNDHHAALGKKITDGCVWAYNATSAGVMPEIVQLVPCTSSDSCKWNEAEWKSAVLERAGSFSSETNVNELIANKHLPPGFAQIQDTRYILRPEAIESVFYMYRTSGDRAYLEHAWQMFTSVNRISKTEFANAAIMDITAMAADGLPPKDDRMESFWLAETLKYAYLIFSEPDRISLDEYVLNTEAHPFKRPI